MQVTDSVHTFDLDWDYGEPLSVHVVEAETTILFGAGDESTASELVDIADDHGVDVVVVEHGDGDHFGGAPRLRSELDVEVTVPAGDAEFLTEGGVDVDHHLDAGETYWGIETIATPGHTPDNMAYLHAASDTLVAGDTVVGSDSTFAAESEWSGPLAPMTPDYNADDARTRESIPRLLDYEFERVLLTHGSNALEDGHEAVETLVEDL